GRQSVCKVCDNTTRPERLDAKAERPRLHLVRSEPAPGPAPASPVDHFGEGGDDELQVPELGRFAYNVDRSWRSYELATRRPGDRAPKDDHHERWSVL